MKFSKLFLMSLLAISCSNGPQPNSETDLDTTQAKDINPSVQLDFNEDSAYQYVKAQVDFGPRVPGTASHLKCYNYLLSHLKSLADTVYTQNSRATTFNKVSIPIYNLIAEFNPNAKKRILLCAHWDTRPFADEDVKDKDQPILGANDGASGVGVLMEVANQIKKLNRPDLGVDIIFFDAEDWGDASGASQNSYCLGSQYWSKNLHRANYTADFGVLLDMVGAPNAMFGYESYSLQHASRYIPLVWGAAAQLGFDNYFKNFERGGVLDDHYYIITNANIPVMDIIDFDPNTESRFGKYWHTHQDNMDAIDKKTLNAVGQTLLKVIADYR
jgi:Zn-dependent M28 family amino/carboxypeptidase